MNSQAKVTVVVPTRNRSVALSGLLSSLHCQSLTRFNVIIGVHGNQSWHPHLDKLSAALGVRGIELTVCDCIGMTFSEMHSRMLNQAQTEYVCRLDDDHVSDPTYLATLLKVIERDEKAGAVGGVVLHPDVPGIEFSENEFLEALFAGRTKGILNTILQLKRHPTNKLLKVPDLYSTFMVKKKTILAVGGIATCYRSSSYREETDLTLRMTFAGYNQYVVPVAFVTHVRADYGGERMDQAEWQRLRAKNEQIFQKHLKAWCKNPVEHFAPLWDQAIADARSFKG
ncbi:MAG: hypothetical protein COV08_01300 [Candidatus Vogelbacteria bacterium CG10_big_fil_rev_8_21_14_0_10_49_38]|uniref:Glycosyltransferase 2-like domain-containing protein n=1 Tax=Candidatus Vogelbacteria bacterium CG10_big_fil_rev_8_21_14_0_10_49_38 TaxID=1975043 RepID=A0A2H0RK46_9BACT|nr:MAG: hypothetical protein BK006_01320 [bacterium CG10_49_38]PIR46145.1 MAG: hypothetical protein COV08_01300 [Candidatus Vogelbacteria bacterium CG10_big_fil_rev_8_21_14_0_10_49_38]